MTIEVNMQTEKQIELSNYKVFDLRKNCKDCQRIVNCYGIDINVPECTNYITISKFGRIMGYFEYPTIEESSWVIKGGCNTMIKRSIVHLGSICLPEGKGMTGWENSLVELKR